MSGSPRQCSQRGSGSRTGKGDKQVDWFPGAAVTKYYHLCSGCLEQQKCIVSQVWRLGVQDQGPGRFGSMPLS